MPSHRVVRPRHEIRKSDFADRFDSFAGFPDQRIDIGDEVLQRTAELVLRLASRGGVVELRPYVVAKTCDRVLKGLCHFPDTTHKCGDQFSVRTRSRDAIRAFLYPRQPGMNAV